MNRQQIADIFTEVATLLELRGDNPFRVRAYANAARIIESLQEDLATLSAANRLTEIKGIGTDLAVKITELLTTDRLRFHDELKASFPPGLLDLLRIPGFGPKKTKAVYDQLQVDSLEKLAAACQADRVAQLAGFGEKSQQKILEGIALLQQFSGRHHYHKALAAAQPVLEALRTQDGVIRCSLAGSLRRCRETIGDVDFLVSAKPADAPAILADFVGMPGVRSVSAHGETKASVVLAGGIQADLRVVTDPQFAFALNYFTGSKEHNIALRGRALKLKNLSLNEYGFSPADKKEKSAKELGSSIPCRTEEELYAALDLEFVPPELREDLGELTGAPLPRLIQKENLRGALHIHSTWSDGVESIEAMANAALDLGLEYIGISDHSHGQRQANGLDAARLRQQAAEVKTLNAKFAKQDFRIFFGTEVDILPDGTLDFDDATLAQCEFVIAAVHSGFTLPADVQTKRICRALAHPLVTMLAHPTGRLLLEREGYAVNLPEVIACAAQHNKIIEINSHPYRLDLDWRYWKHAKELGVKCAINPDAHSIDDFQYLAIGTAIARKGWLEKSDVINCLPAKELAKIFKNRVV